MFPYYLLIIIPFFGGAVECLLQPNRGDIFSKKTSNKSIILFFSIWFVMLALRHINCGVDLRAYEMHFYYISKLDFVNAFTFSSLEHFYYIFNYFVAQVYPDFRLFLIITAALCAGITGWFYWKESEIAPLTILLFVTNAPFVMFYSGLRQALAMLLVVPAYYLTKEKKIIPFILIVLFASYFHTSAVVMFFLYPLYHVPLKSKYFSIVLGLVVCFFVLKSQIFNGILPFLGERYIDRYGTIQETNGFGMWAFFVISLIISFVLPDERKMTHEILGLRNILILMALIQGFAPLQPIAMRMNYYFIMLFPIIIPKFLNRPKEGWENIAQFTKWGLVIFLTLFFLYKINFTENILKAWPYVAYWE